MRLVLASTAGFIAFAVLFGAFARTPRAIEAVFDRSPSAVVASLKDSRPGARHVLE